ncbi:MAG: sulfate permease [Gammaproteobacteria bacterium]|nr:sulfate permease [Gammaproteobacteria bacterium]
MYKKFLPFLSWFPISSRVLRADLIAGITVALVLIPQSMAYAQLAGLPPYQGLYAAFLPVLVAALFGSSKQLATGPVAVVSLLTASALMPLAGIGDEQFIALAILMAMMVGIVQLTLGILKLGLIVNFLSHPVILGFTNAAAIIIGLSQIPKVFGISMGRSETFIKDIWDVFQHLDQTHLPTLVFGLSAILGMWLIKKNIPKAPDVLIAVIVTTVVSWGIGFEDMGGKVVGHVPAGLPDLSIPVLDIDMIFHLLPTAVVIAMVGFMEAISIAKSVASLSKDRIDPDQELIGQGLANIFGSFTQAYPASGSFSRTAVNFNAGAKTGMSSVFTALMVLITLLLLTPLLYHLPLAVLAAVIIMAVGGLIHYKSSMYAWNANKQDGIASLVTFVATLGFAPHLDKGIMAGAGLAMGIYLYRNMRPRVAHLGRFEDGTLRDLEVHPDLPTDQRIIVIRFDGGLFFANVSYFEDNILHAVSDKPEANYLLVVGDGINQLDASGEVVLHHLVDRLKNSNMTMVFSGLKRQVLDVMRRTQLYENIGRENLFATKDMALASIYKRLGDNQFCPLLNPELLISEPETPEEEPVTS